MYSKCENSGKQFCLTPVLHILFHILDFLGFLWKKNFYNVDARESTAWESVYAVLAVEASLLFEQLVNRQHLHSF